MPREVVARMCFKLPAGFSNHKLIRRRGTNMSESSNKQINQAIDKQSRLSGKLAEAKIALRVHDHNLKKDRKFGNMTGCNAKSIVWFLQEANDLSEAGAPLLKETVTIDQMKEKGHFKKQMTCPPTDFVAEPMGLDHMTGNCPEQAVTQEVPEQFEAKPQLETEARLQPGKFSNADDLAFLSTVPMSAMDDSPRKKIAKPQKQATKDLHSTVQQTMQAHKLWCHRQQR